MSLPARRPASPLAALEKAQAALEAASTVGEVRDIRDRAEALRTYARTAGLGLEAQNRCAALRIRAEHKAGRLLAATISRGGDRRPGARLRDATLADLGISRSQSSRWQQVGRLTDAELEAYFSACVETGREITTSALVVLALGAARRRQASVPDLPATSGYRTVLVDPPWPYDEGTRYKQTRPAHYPEMSLEQIRSLPVADLAASDGAHLYLWATNAFMRHAFSVVDAWGFEHRTVITWCKPQLGVGVWYRNTTEHLVFATRGVLPTLRADVGTWFSAPRGRHSQKPEEAFELIEAVSPGPRIELFARTRRRGWDAWGDEVAELDA